MSYYTKFQDVETVVTSSSTANLMRATDPILIYSSALSRPGQSTVSSVSCMIAVSTSSSTASVIANSGMQVLTSAANASYQLADPAQKGQVVSIFNTSTTSTAITITPVSATISGTESTAGAAATLIFKAGPGNVELTALSTSQWLVTARSASILCT